MQILTTNGPWLKMSKMQYPKNKTRASPALTLLEMILALAIMATIFAAILPLFANIRNSWDSKQAAAETLQNGRVLIDHLNRNLAKVVKITAVSDASTINGYIQFEDNDGNNLKYDIANNYVRFGVDDDLSDLAGPVSQLQFTCYDANDFSTPITDVNHIRFVKAETVLTNSASMGQDKTFTSSVYLRTNANKQEEGIAKKTPFEYDILQGETPVLAQIDDTHYLCAYTGWDGSGQAVVLTVTPITWTISKGTVFKFDTSKGKTPALARIDDDNYLCAYEGPDSDGWTVVLTVNPITWTLSKRTAFEYDTSKGKTPALEKIDDNHYLCAYEGNHDDGWATVLTVNTGTWTITKETPFEFDNKRGRAPALAKIDNTQHYLCAYEGDHDDGWATVLTVNTGAWTITKETPFEFDNKRGEAPALAKIDNMHYLCAYQGDHDDGWATVLTVNTETWTITKETPFEYDSEKARAPALAKIDNSRYLCDYSGKNDDGWAVILAVDPATWTISKETPFEYDDSKGEAPALEKIDDNHCLCTYEGKNDDGWSVVLEIDIKVKP